MTTAARLSRRGLIRLGAALAGSTLAAACAGRDVAFDQFLAVSAVLTGVPRDRLDQSAARAYLAALQSPPAGGLTAAQVAQSGLIGANSAPTGADALRSKGFLAMPAAKITADRIAEYWYRGQVSPVASVGAPPVVVTYRDALGWSALTFAAAPATCAGAFGFWSNKPVE